MFHIPRKPLKWVGSSKKDLDKMPEDVKDLFGFAIALLKPDKNIQMQSHSKDLNLLVFWK